MMAKSMFLKPMVERMYFHQGRLDGLILSMDEKEFFLGKEN
jgi:hypothetical protein